MAICLYFDMKVTTRAARELTIPSLELVNENVKVKIGATEKRDAPSTIYIQISFWTQPKENLLELSNEELHEILDANITQVFNENVKEYLKSNFYFTRPKDNIFIKNVPDNLNYNQKRNYISLDLYLHTLNLNKGPLEEKYPLNSKKDKRLYEAALCIVNKFIEHKFFDGEMDFKIFKTSKK